MKKVCAVIALVSAVSVASPAAASAQTPVESLTKGKITAAEYRHIDAGEIKKIVEQLAHAWGPKVCSASTDGGSKKIVGYLYATNHPGKYVWIRYVNVDGWNRVAQKWWRTQTPAHLCI